MKKVLALLMIGVVLLLSVGCREEVTAKFESDLNWNEEKQQYENEKGAEIKLWTDNDEYIERIEELWNEKYPDVKLTFENVETAEMAEQLELDGPAGLAGDVFYMPHDNIVAARESGTLFKLPERDKQEVMARMQESAYKVTMYQDDMYAIPSSVENLGLVYNKQILEVLPPLPTVLDTSASNLLEQIENEEIYFEELLAGVTQWGNNFAGTGVDIPYIEERFDLDENGESVQDIHTVFAWELYNGYVNYPLLTRDGYRVFGENNDDPSQFNITSDAVTSSIEAITGDWYGNVDGSKLFPGLAKSEDLNWDQTGGRLQNGQLGITITGPWVLGDIMKDWDSWVESNKFGATEETSIADIFGATAIPRFSNGQAPTTFSGVQVTGVNIYTKYPNASMNLLRFLASDEIMVEVYEVLRKIPAVKDSSTIPGLSEDTISQGFLKQAANSHPMPVIEEGRHMWDPLRDVWPNIFDEKMSVEEAQQKSQEDYERIIRDAGSK